MTNGIMNSFTKILYCHYVCIAVLPFEVLFVLLAMDIVGTGGHYC